MRGTLRPRRKSDRCGFDKLPAAYCIAIRKRDLSLPQMDRFLNWSCAMRWRRPFLFHLLPALVRRESPVLDRLTVRRPIMPRQACATSLYAWQSHIATQFRKRPQRVETRCCLHDPASELHVHSRPRPLARAPSLSHLLSSSVLIQPLSVNQSVSAVLEAREQDAFRRGKVRLRRTLV